VREQRAVHLDSEPDVLRTRRVNHVEAGRRVEACGLVLWVTQHAGDNSVEGLGHGSPVRRGVLDDLHE